MVTVKQPTLSGHLYEDSAGLAGRRPRSSSIWQCCVLQGQEGAGIMGPVRLWAKHSSHLSRWTSPEVLRYMLALNWTPWSDIPWLHPASATPQQDTLHRPVLCAIVKPGWSAWASPRVSFRQASLISKREFLWERSVGCHSKVLTARTALLDMGELASFGAPGFESWALEVWFCLELFSWSFTHQASQEHKRRPELHCRGQTLFSKLCSSGELFLIYHSISESKPGP